MFLIGYLKLIKLLLPLRHENKYGRYFKETGHSGIE